MKVAFCSSEVFPFSKTGGLADVCGALPLALEGLGVETYIFTPAYQGVKDKYDSEALSSRASIVSLSEKVHVVLIESRRYSEREGLYGDHQGDFADNLNRFQFFSQKVLETIRDQKLDIDVIHCHDWQTALIPVYLKTVCQSDHQLNKIKSVLTIHNLAFQGVFDSFSFSELQLPDRLFSSEGLEFYGQINFLKGGILFADVVNTVSPQYAKEILTKEFGCGLENVLQSRKNPVLGVLNGIDQNFWNPQVDEFLEKTYDLSTVEDGKQANKRVLQEMVGLKIDSDIPVFGMVTRLSHQKGVDLLIEILPKFLERNVQVIVQGLGDEKHERMLSELQSQFPEKLVFRKVFEERLAHEVYAGADFFLMPSVFEPCGLSQLISLYYGTLPIVYGTGGLLDTIVDVGEKGSTGFVFQEYSAPSFLNCLEKACCVFENKDAKGEMIERAMKEDFSWNQSAQKYKEIYQCLLSD